MVPHLPWLTVLRYEPNLALFTLFNWDYGFREGPVFK